MHDIPPEAAPPRKPVPVRPVSIRYLGFECTSAGRAYRLRLDGTGDPRLVTVTIPTAAFESRKARYQDAPELCFARLQRELVANAELPDGLALVITPAELDEYREAQLRRSPDKKVRALRTWP
ncbi:MAG TPA: hypothetical protein VGB87_22375 [Vicinamibacteria bacterium]